MSKFLSIFFIILFPFACFAENNFFPVGQKRSVNTMKALKTSMDYSLQRHKLLSTNIASQNIPGYRSSDLKKIDFNKTQQYNHQLKTAKTDPKHFGPGDQPKYFKEIKEKFNNNSSLMKNNVDLTDQMTRVNDNITNYNLSSTLYKQNTNLIKTAIGR